ncbi:hypothetical protein ANO14919_140620 [Xylariales sp. No.14919]|nr:hypothetical protein ANO14919_140620 [Xylariales sp. No.14919]
MSSGSSHRTRTSGILFELSGIERTTIRGRFMGFAGGTIRIYPRKVQTTPRDCNKHADTESQSTEFDYNIRFFQRNYRLKARPWSLRQTGVY